MKEIQHKVYFKGAVQSLKEVNDEGRATMSIGMVMQGDYDFGVAEECETIEVITGVLIINGERVERGQWAKTIKPDEEILITAEVDSTYRCNYGDPSGPDDCFLLRPPEDSGVDHLVTKPPKDGPDPLGR